jgi:hypothetical protein
MKQNPTLSWYVVKIKDDVPIKDAIIKKSTPDWYTTVYEMVGGAL